MMDQVDEKPFADVLQEIFNDDPLPIHLLYRLSDLTDEQFGQFEAAWQQAPADLRRVIARHLVDISEEDYIVDFAPIFSCCLADEAVPVRVAGLDGFWDSTDLKLIPKLIEMLESDEAMDVRAAAAGALAHFVLMSEWGEMPETVSPPIVAALLAVYDDPETAVVVRCAVIEALGAATHPRITNIIRNAYESDDEGMQQSAVFAMGNSADTQWVPVLLNEMRNEASEMRAEAARAAGVIGSSDTVSQLVELTDDEDIDVQIAAIMALGQVGSATAQRVLEEILEDEERMELHDAVEAALEEMSWIDGDLDFMDIGYDDDEDEDDELDAF